MKSIALVVIRRVYWDRGRLASPHRFTPGQSPIHHSAFADEDTGLTTESNQTEVAFNERRRDARVPT